MVVQDSLERPVFPKSVLLGCVVMLVCVAFLPSTSWGHGTMLIPESRVHLCRFADNPEDPMDPACAAAVQWAGGDPQFLYDWAGIRQGDADGNHQQVVPDGQLCSGGGVEYGGLDLPRSDWRTTAIAPDGSGNFEFIYRASAPHETRDMIFFVTRDGWDPEQPLAWQDLDSFCHITDVTLEPYPQDPSVNGVYRMTCPLPSRAGRHLIYNVWQRSDSPEAFYACIDVVFQPTGAIFADGFESGDTALWSATVE
ncbi:MAG: lytic polysaccharide monooxygenase auxiliary activity family 9 protein [Acidobacteriota bacterium]